MPFSGFQHISLTTEIIADILFLDKFLRETAEMDAMSVTDWNVVLFLATVVAYFIVWRYFGGSWGTLWGAAKRLAILAVLSAPFNVGGDVWTVLGNAKSEKSVHSVFSVYQDAKEDASALFHLGWQKAGGDAKVRLFGVSAQDAWGSASINLGVALCQRSSGYTVLNGGIAVYQADGLIVSNRFGITLSQKGSAVADTYGFAVYQKILGKSRVFSFGKLGNLEYPK